MIVWGSRMYGKKNRVDGWGRCEHCGRTGKTRHYDARKWGHLYFIPLIPMGGHVRVVDECASCKTGSHVPADAAAAMAAGAVDLAGRSAARIEAGELTYTEDGEPGNAAGDVAGAVSIVYRLHGPAEAEGLLAELAPRLDPPTLALAEARLHEARGEVDAALAKLADAEAGSAEPLPVRYARAVLLRDAGRGEQAAEVYQSLVAEEPGDVMIRLELFDVMTSLKRHVEAADLMEEAFVLAPELQQEKKLLKLYKKACKKAKRPPAV